jgi:hypothetical protein
MGNIFLPWVVHMCDMATPRVLEPGNHALRLQTDGQPDSSITPSPQFVAGDTMKTYRIQMENIVYKWKIIQYKWKIIQYKWKRSIIATLGMQ